MNKILIFASIFSILTSSAWSDGEQVILSQLLCNTTHERTIYYDGSEGDGFRNDYHPIKSAIIKVIDIPKYDRRLFVKFESPYVDVSKKETFGVSHLETRTFEIKFNNIYPKSDYTGVDFTANFGNYSTIKKKNQQIAISETWEDSVSILFMECREL